MTQTTTERLLAEVAGNPLQGLRRADALWYQLRHGTLTTPAGMSESTQPLESIDWDVLICGGTLGILVGCGLAQQGWRVAILERGALRGRDQEWNISRKEVQSLVTLGLLTEEELERAIATTYNPGRIAFHQGKEFWVRDVLNIGIDPVYLLDTLKTRFLAAGGILLEHAAFEAATVHPNGVQVQVERSAVEVDSASSHTDILSTRLLIDAMGHFSPIARQARAGQQPDAVCMVVGTCAIGFPHNDSGDLFVSMTPVEQQRQYFWEAFPARDGRTTYLFTYVDAHPDRPSLEAMFEDYFRLLPEYQQVELAQLHIVRSLFGVFPCYRNSPLQPKWPRVMHLGDSSGSQSPLSFGGFGALIRHLPRLIPGIHEALTADLLNRSALGLLHPYQPGLSVTWLFQQSMSVGMAQNLPPDQINQLLSAVFAEMSALGDPVLKPFLQDVVQFPALFQTLMLTSIRHPALVLKIVPQVGLPALLDWLRHYASLGAYAGLAALGTGVESRIQALPGRSHYYARRWLESWRYGAGLDYHPD